MAKKEWEPKFLDSQSFMHMVTQYPSSLLLGIHLRSAQHRLDNADCGNKKGQELEENQKTPHHAKALGEMS